MKTLWFEFILTLRRIFRRPTQNGLLLVTFAISVTLSVLTWSLFRSVHLSTPDFDPKGEYLVLAHKDKMWVASGQLTREEMELYTAGQEVFSEMHPLAFYLSAFVNTPSGYERVLAAFPSSSGLQLTGAKPLLGTLFTAEDDRNDAPPRILISERLWRDSYGSDPDIVGKSIEWFEKPWPIIGVLPVTYRFPNDQDIWINYGAVFDSHKSRYALRTALVKLKPGVPRARAEQDLRAMQTALPPDSPPIERKELPVLRDYREMFLLAELKVSSTILLALSLLFLAVSCANAANLMIIDFLGRRAEVATNLALGIPRRAAVRHVCWHVLLITFAAAAIALCILPSAGTALFDRIRVINSPYWMTYQFSAADVVAGLLAAGIAGLATLVMPIIYLLLADPEKIIRDHAYTSRGTGKGNWRRVLLAGQIAILTILGVSSALLVRSNRNVGESRWGFDAGRVFECKTSVLSINYGDGNWGKRRFTSQRQILEEVRRRPDTEHAAFVENPQGYSNGPYCTYAADPAALTGGTGQGEAFFSQVTDDYFAVLGVPILSGRDFSLGMPYENSPDVILTAGLASRLWPGEDFLGRTVYVRYPGMKDTDPPARHIVRAVVDNFQANGPRARSNDAIFTIWGGGSQRHPGSVFTYIRDRTGHATFKSVNDAVHRAEPRAAIFFPSTIKRQIELMLNSVRMTTDLTTIFAIAAVLLCAIGVYSLTITQVLQSSREFGIRMALGAEPHSLWQTFTKGHLLTACVGVLIGIIGASQLIRLLESLLFGVNARDPFTYIGVALAILAVAALACLPSLRRLKRINPADCLRSL